MACLTPLTFFSRYSRLRKQYSLVSPSYLPYDSLLIRSYPCDIQTIQTANGIISTCDALVDLLEAIESFVNRLDIYTQISSTPAIDEIVIKIFVELLSTLAQVTERLKQRRLSESVLAPVLSCSATRSQAGKEPSREEGHRGGLAKVGPTHARRSSNCCSSDTPSPPWPRPEYERGRRW